MIYILDFALHNDQWFLLFQSFYQAIWINILQVHLGSLPYHMCSSLLWFHSYLAIILGLFLLSLSSCITLCLICIFLMKLVILLRVVNEPLESISIDLGFQGNTLQEGDQQDPSPCCESVLHIKYLILIFYVQAWWLVLFLLVLLLDPLSVVELLMGLGVVERFSYVLCLCSLVVRHGN